MSRSRCRRNKPDNLLLSIAEPAATMRSRRLVSNIGPLFGQGLHTGLPSSLVIEPALAGGIAFYRADRPATGAVPVTLESAVARRRRTVLAQGPVEISTVEHVLSALRGTGISDARVVVDGPEVPIFDGSAQIVATALLDASEPRPAAAAIPRWAVFAPFSCSDGPSSCTLTPYPLLRVDCAIDFHHPAVGRQRRVFDLDDPHVYVSEIAPARTFGFFRDADALRRAGLARGASLDTALVFGDVNALGSEGLRFADEPVRHKILDAIGDVALLGAPLQGALQLERCSHALLLTTLRSAAAAGTLRCVTADS